MTLATPNRFPRRPSPNRDVSRMESYDSTEEHPVSLPTSSVHTPMIREFHWAGIAFGTATGLITSYILFVISGPLGGNILVQLAIQLLGFIAAGYVAGRFSLTYAVTAGRIASLLLFFFIAALTIAAGANANIFGLALLGILAIGGGAAGATWAEKRKTT